MKCKNSIELSFAGQLNSYLDGNKQPNVVMMDFLKLILTL